MGQNFLMGLTSPENNHFLFFLKHFFIALLKPFNLTLYPGIVANRLPVDIWSNEKQKTRQTIYDLIDDFLTF